MKCRINVTLNLLTGQIWSIVYEFYLNERAVYNLVDA